MRRILLPIFLMAGLLISACSPEEPAGPPPPEPVFAAETVPETRVAFTTEDFLEDYDQLWELLDENYPFFGVLERRGLDLEKLRADNRWAVATRVNDAQGFMALLDGMFYRMGNFAHLSVVKPDLYGLHVALYASPDSDFDPQNPWAQVVTAPQTQTLYALLESETPPSEASSAAAYPAVTLKYFPELKAAYFGIKSFDASLVERDLDIVADYLSGLPAVEHIILDITGNHGGSDLYWMDNIVGPFGGAYVLEEYIFLGLTPVNERFFVNNDPTRFQPISALPESCQVPSFAEACGFEYFYARRDTFPRDDYKGERVESEVKRWVLIDGQVFSAADRFAGFCKKTGWATLVGQTTLGDGDGFAPVLVTLSNTGLLVRFSSCSAVNADGSMNAETGTSPDVACGRQETPLEACLQAIARYERLAG